MSRNNNMVHFVIKQLPVARLDVGDALFDRIVRRSAALLASSPYLRSLEKEVGVKRLDDPSDREEAKAEVDACAARTFGLSDLEFEHIMKRFDGIPESVRQRVLLRFRSEDT